MQKYRKALFELIAHNQAYMDALSVKGATVDPRPLRNIASLIDRIVNGFGTIDDQNKFTEISRRIQQVYNPTGSMDAPTPPDEVENQVREKPEEPPGKVAEPEIDEQKMPKTEG